MTLYLVGVIVFFKSSFPMTLYEKVKNLTGKKSEKTMCYVFLLSLILYYFLSSIMCFLFNLPSSLQVVLYMDLLSFNENRSLAFKSIPVKQNREEYMTEPERWSTYVIYQAPWLNSIC